MNGIASSVERRAFEVQITFRGLYANLEKSHLKYPENIEFCFFVEEYMMFS
jgi:hypothetical protein